MKYFSTEQAVAFVTGENDDLFDESDSEDDLAELQSEESGESDDDIDMQIAPVAEAATVLLPVQPPVPSASLPVSSVIASSPVTSIPPQQLPSLQEPVPPLVLSPVRPSYTI